MAVLGYALKLGNALLRNKKFCKWKKWGNYMYLMKMQNGYSFDNNNNHGRIKWVIPIEFHIKCTICYTLHNQPN